MNCGDDQEPTGEKPANSLSSCHCRGGLYCKIFFHKRGLRWKEKAIAGKPVTEFKIYYISCRILEIRKMIDKTEDPPNTEQKNSSNSTIKQTTFISIIASIIAQFVFVIILQPIFAFISDIVVTIIGVFYHGYIDTLYEQAPVGITNEMIFWILSIALIFIFSCILVLIFLIINYITIILTTSTKIIAVKEISQEILQPIENTLFQLSH